MQGDGSRFGEDRGLREGEGGRKGFFIVISKMCLWSKEFVIVIPDLFIVISKNCWSFFDRAGDSGRVFE